VTDDNAIFFGAFTGLNSFQPDLSPGVLPYRLAFEDFSGDSLSGLPGGPGGKSRPLVMIVCSGDPAYVDAGVKHLVGDDPDSVHVPAILAYMKPGDLNRSYNNYHPEQIFWLNPGGSNGVLTGTSHQGFMWHMLGQPIDLVPAYAEVVRLAEKYARNVRGAGTRPIRLAMVTTSEAFDKELADLVGPALRFNDKDTTENGDNYLGISIDLNAPDITGIGLRVCQFQPDIIVSTAGDAFVQRDGIVTKVEMDWDGRCRSDAGSMPRPFYVLSPANGVTDGSYITQLIQSQMTPPVRDSSAFRRFVGINAARSADATLYNRYLSRLSARFPDVPNSTFKETDNFYDAFYYLAYAMYAAGSVPKLTGPSIAAGMARLVDGPTIYNIDRTEITNVYSALNAQLAHIKLNSTLGVMQFNLSTGARFDPGSMFCYHGDELSSIASVRTQVLRYVPGDGGSTGGFVGDFATQCYPGFFP